MKYTTTPVQAIDNMWQEYQCHWPPRPTFSEWPNSWKTYQEVCDEMPKHLCEALSPAEFRNWLTCELEAKVNLDEAMREIRLHYTKDDKRLLGFLACLTFLKNGYRWGKLPADKEERERKSLDIPDIIDMPMREVSKLHGNAPYGTVFSMLVANTIYEDDEPVRMRFHFNSDPDIIKSEENFFLPFVTMENIFKAAVCDIKEYLELTEKAKQSRVVASELFSQRLILLRHIREILTQASKVFSKFTMGTMINKEDWARFVQVPTTWGLGGKGGASGGETFMFQLLDEFLYIPGKCLMFTSKPLRREHMAASVRETLHAMGTADHSERFDNFLGLDKDIDPIWQAKEELVKTLHLWRLGHAHVVRRFVEKSEGLASTLEKKMDVKQSIAAAAEDELLQRARETVAQNITKTPPKVAKVQQELLPHNYLKSIASICNQVIDYILPMMW